MAGIAAIGQAARVSGGAGGPGHGRRDYSHPETEERFIDVEACQRYCAVCGKAFEFIGTEDSEQVDWQVKITRIVSRRRRYRRRDLRGYPSTPPSTAPKCWPPCAGRSPATPGRHIPGLPRSLP
jgi:hypothetical protein